ncbi:MAG: hypothetical protein CMN56_09860 [Sneathiella sp.]|uniref:hypothetical protein n=1 Tax=Sneathiella sp. TaxID=1964365 RepID=UPI000C57D61F|nr:hypothetical protein [Sneathiella sp.]MAZ03431.1 hypothetical protein [Sneathiella sp.]
MNDLLHEHNSGNISLADINRSVREGRRLRAEEVLKLMGRANALVRKFFSMLYQGLKPAGKWMTARLEASTLRHQQTRLHYD